MATPALPETTDALDDLNLVHTLAPVRAFDLEGEPVRLGTLWEDRPAVLVFLRHFG
jgi:hypothetical protein